MKKKHIIFRLSLQTFPEKPIEVTKLDCNFSVRIIEVLNSAYPSKKKGPKHGK